MSKIKNIANSADELAEVNRGQIEKRATWMGLMYDEIKKAGLDAEGIVRRAIKRCGLMRGEELKKQCPNPSTCEDFRKVFPSDLGVRSFNMHNFSVDKDNLKTNFQYCALVSGWQKLGFDDETCALLCDLAMEGDRAIAEAMGLHLDLGETIAQGCPECHLHFHK